MVAKWVDPQWEEQHNACWERRLMMQGAPHHKGSLTLSEYASRWSDSHGGQACGQFKAWAMAHKGKATFDVNYNPEDLLEAYSNASIHSRLSEYTSMAWEVHGPEYDPSVENLDAEIVMRVGAGKKHMRYWICDSTIDTASTPSLSQIRARSTSSSPAIRSRPTTTHAQMEALRAQLEQERLRQEEIEPNMLAQRVAVEADRQRVQAAQQQIEVDQQAIAADRQRVEDMCCWMHSLGEKMGQPIPPMIYTPPPPASTPGQPWASNDPNPCPNP
ncbi:hypothetical protein QOZ80_7BG0589810 [Eleusine coracana subsp. coracana]|nr:hypothetical protein QOZ80_7BG0589810 [Eleusine coracana subsp. coracana]